MIVVFIGFLIMIFMFMTWIALSLVDKDVRRTTKRFIVASSNSNRNASDMFDDDYRRRQRYSDMNRDYDYSDIGSVNYKD